MSEQENLRSRYGQRAREFAAEQGWREPEGAGVSEIWRAVFDVAVGSADFGSGFLDDEEVAALRAAAVILGVDPDTATPRQFICKYRGHHAAIVILDRPMFTGLDGVLRNAYRRREEFPEAVWPRLSGSAPSQAAGLGILRAPAIRMFCPDCGMRWDALEKIPQVSREEQA